jgi:hypothetical protein
MAESDVPIGSDLLQEVSVNKRNRAKITFVILNNVFIEIFSLFPTHKAFRIRPVFEMVSGFHFFNIVIITLIGQTYIYSYLFNRTGKSFKGLKIYSHIFYS